MPKRICSPSRPSEPITRHHHRHHTRKSSNLGASPLLWAKTNNHNNTNSDISEPTSPKVTCAGQIKVRPKAAASCKNWQSVMEEIERIHNKGKQKRKKKPAWIEALGFKKDVMQFLTCLRNIRFDFRCFGSFPTTSEITSEDEEEEEEDEDEDEEHIPRALKEESSDENCTSDVFSKWFMILQDDQGKEEERKGKLISSPCLDDNDDDGPCVAPPPNALLLMRCRSAPAKSWLEEKEEEEEKDYYEKQKEKEQERKESLVVMRYGGDFSKISSDIAKETWVNVGGGTGIKDMLSRSSSSKR
ncbi:hypothetical protein BUALT_Bualt17G0054000 [Buddleja alternifolia]|uniref:Uncharacterized protein n=1 Tax=Buddleja alternifolia TaxID=168488 RepID=A0AAV6W4D6_9LAMI|nr:hypothetical protein BUALT_Bualt17G0054000 [Buddleja alternifolia]